MLLDSEQTWFALAPNDIQPPNWHLLLRHPMVMRACASSTEGGFAELPIAAQCSDEHVHTVFLHYRFQAGRIMRVKMNHDREKTP